MKNCLVIILLFFLSLAGSAQIGGVLTGLLLDHDDLLGENFSFDLTHSTFIGQTNQVKQNWNSAGYNFGVMLNKELSATSVRFSVGYGLRYAANNFRSDGILNKYDSLNITKLEKFDIDTTRSSYKISLRYLEIPIELRWRFDSRRFEVIRVTAGCVFGAKVKAFDRSVYGNIEVQRNNLQDIQNFRVGLMARFGLPNVGLYASYYLNPVLKNSVSSQLNVLSFGLNFAL